MEHHRKKISYYHNRHRSDGVLIESQEKNNQNQENQNIFLEFVDKKNDKNETIDNKNMITEENLSNYIAKNNNNERYITSKSENYMNFEYLKASNKLSGVLSELLNHLSRPLPKRPKNNRNREISLEINLDEENLKLTKENIRLEKQINFLRTNSINNNLMEEPTKKDIEKLYNINQKIKKENQNFSILINRIKNHKNNENKINNSIKYKADFLIQNIVSSMEDLVYLLGNKNINSSSDSGGCSVVPHENLGDFTEQSFNEGKAKEQFNFFDFYLENQMINNSNYFNDISRNLKDKEINIQSNVKKKK